MEQDAATEVQAILDVQAGDQAAFSSLYESYADNIYSYIYYKTHHRETAQDITSHVFIKALAGINGLKAQEGAFRRWIYTIARNAVIDHYRTDRQHADIADIWDLANDDDIARDADLKMRLSKVQEYMKDLDSVQRDIVLLRVWQDMPYADIAVIVGKSADNCKMIFSRVVRKMRADVAVLLALALVRLYL